MSKQLYAEAKAISDDDDRYDFIDDHEFSEIFLHIEAHNLGEVALKTDFIDILRWSGVKPYLFVFLQSPFTVPSRPDGTLTSEFEAQVIEIETVIANLEQFGNKLPIRLTILCGQRQIYANVGYDHRDQIEEQLRQRLQTNYVEIPSYSRLLERLQEDRWSALY